MNVKTALVLAPHPDDGEFGCGGTIKKLTENGCRVYYAAFSPCVASLPEGFDKDSLFKELKTATAHLGIKNEDVFTYDIPVRYFTDHRQIILEELVKLRKKIKPELVFMPNSNDIHQDHQVIYNEGIRAFKHSKLLGFELIWNSLKFISNFHVKLEAKHITAKAKAISEYKSQTFRYYASEAFLGSLANVRGVQVNTDFAEAFELIRWIED
jgi:LmbE family N-acetylglucosaminyl deacetylase